MLLDRFIKNVRNHIFNRNKTYALNATMMIALFTTGIPIAILLIAGIITLGIFAYKKIKKDVPPPPVADNPHQNYYRNQTVAVGAYAGKENNLNQSNHQQQTTPIVQDNKILTNNIYNKTPETISLDDTKRQMLSMG